MMSLNFYIVDVFAEEKYSGNQLAVLTVANSLTDEEMQRIAREVNYSETTFILCDRPNNGGYDVRIFTPKKELPFAGHPTLGTAFILQQEMIRNPVETVNLNLKVGQIPVQFSYREGKPDVLWMRQNAPTFHRQLSIEAIAPALGLAIEDFDPRFPVQEVSTGIPFWIAPLASLDALKRAKIDLDRYSDVVASSDAREILLFAPEAYQKDSDLSARMFAPLLGVPEDPATGSANGCLAAYLVQNQYFGTEAIDVRVDQGYEIDRPSLLLLKARKTSEAISVHVGGRVVAIARGTWG
ncbi:MAG: PhzF family phenazine biosynthesis protein [Cyanobacteria bacterium J007]|jgi:trans-2,3-dihydro-3-hydroxyanthranilate isomerase|nr:MAG: PhzF family phenazine biosynthesis protein [Cyanobacteria bacterium J007]